MLPLETQITTDRYLGELCFDLLFCSLKKLTEVDDPPHYLVKLNRDFLFKNFAANFFSLGCVYFEEILNKF